MTDNDPSAPGALSVTLKHDGKYEAPWVVAHGSPGRIKDQLAEFFGLDPEHVAPLTAYDVALECDSISKGMYAAAKTLGGRPLPAASSTGQGSPAPATGFGAIAQGQQPAAEPAPEVTPEEKVTAAIEAATTVKELQVDIWGPNQALLNANADLMAAWKAKGKELSAA